MDHNLLDGHIHYTDEKKTTIRTHLEKGIREPKFTDKSEVYLKDLEEQKLKFIIMIVDIVGSTQYSQTWEPKKFKRLLTSFLFETSELIPQYNGYVLKYLGDGLISFFTDSKDKHRSHLALECATAIHDFVYNTFNPIIEKAGYPRIDIRVGIDSGLAYVSNVGSPQVKQHKDIIGGVINITEKLQSRAGPGEVFLGEEFAKHLLKRDINIIDEVKLKNWPYKVHNKRYKVYKVAFKHEE